MRQGKPKGHVTSVDTTRRRVDAMITCQYSDCPNRRLGRGESYMENHVITHLGSVRTVNYTAEELRQEGQEMADRVADYFWRNCTVCGPENR